MTFKLDTGAEVTAVSRETYEKLRKQLCAAMWTAVVKRQMLLRLKVKYAGIRLE